MVKLIFENAFVLLLSVCLSVCLVDTGRSKAKEKEKEKEKEKDLVMPSSTSPGSHRKKWKI
jgi:hypothetical protein